MSDKEFNEEAIIDLMIDAYNERFCKWEEQNPGRLPVGANYECMEATFKALIPYFYHTKEQ